MEVTCSFEALVGFQRTTRLYIPEDRTVSDHCCENLNFYAMKGFCSIISVTGWKGWDDMRGNRVKTGLYGGVSWRILA
jgi:hypothetical protein